MNNPAISAAFTHFQYLYFYFIGLLFSLHSSPSIFTVSGSTRFASLKDYDPAYVSSKLAADYQGLLTPGENKSFIGILSNYTTEYAI